jgi:hypothetical protein
MKSPIEHTKKMDITIKYERLGSHSDDADNSSILGCDTVVWPVVSVVPKDWTTFRNALFLVTT